MAQEEKQPHHVTNSERLTEAIEELDDTLEASLRAQGLLPTFIRGIAGSLGALLGATVIIGVLVFILQKLAGVPFIGHYILTILNQLQQK